MRAIAACHTITPFFIVDDVVRSAEYYRDVLGFGFDHLWGEPPCFAMVGRGRVEIMLSSAVGPGHVHPNRSKHPEAGWDAYVRITGGEALYAEFQAKGAKIIRQPQVTFYEMREFEIEDCNGYVLCFGEDVSKPSATGADAMDSTQLSGGNQMTKNGVKTTPTGLHTVTPGLIIRGAAEAIDFYKKAFGAVELVRFAGPGGHGIMHARIRIGDSTIMLSDEFPGCKSPATLGHSTGSLMIYVEDVDAAYEKAVAAGARGDRAPANMFWGDRFAKLTDPFGHDWSLATHIEDITDEEIARRGQEFFAKMGSGCT